MPQNPSGSSNASSRFEAVLAEIIGTEEEGRSIDVEDYCRGFPEFAEQLRDYFRNRSHFAHKARGRSPTASNRTESPALPDLAPGSQFEDYEIVREMGRGGMGVVYLARQLKANRLVALKLIRKDRLEHLSQEQRRRWMSRFCDEAKNAARFDHDRVVTVYEVGSYGGNPFYAMRYIEGQSLAEKLENGPLPNRQAAILMEQVARAVQAIHDHKVKHRDLKPHNILVDAQGRPYMTDFGLAKSADAEESLTQTGEMLGSPAYMSPERAHDSSQVTEATGVYGLGATLYALLTGGPPFSGKTVAETLDQVKNREPVPPRRLNSAVDRDLNTIALRCLEKEPERRFRSAGAMADELQRYLEGRPILSRPVGPAGRAWRWCRRKPALAIVSATAIVFITLAGSLYLAYSAASHSAHQAGRTLGEQQEKSKQEKERTNRKEYGAQMNLVQREYEANNLDRVRELLEAQVPKEAGVTDSRNFEWYYWQRMAHRELLTIERHSRQGLRFEIDCVSFSPDGRLLASAGGDATVRLWDAATGTELHNLKGHTGIVSAVAFSQDGLRLASAGEDGMIRLWEAATGKELHTLMGHKGIVRGVAFSPDGQRLASAGGWADHTVRVWDTTTGKELQNLKGNMGAVVGVTFSPDGQRLISVGEYAKARVWDAATGRELQTFQGDHGNVQGAAFSPDGRLVALAGRSDHMMRLLDARTGRNLYTFQGNTSFVQVMAFSPDNRRLASAGGDSVVRLWNAETGKELLTLKGHRGGATGVAFSPDGRRLASCFMDGTVRLWNAVTDQEWRTLRGHTRMEKVVVFQDGRPRHEDRARGVTVRAVAFSPDGRRLASAGDDRVVRVWDAETGGELLALMGHTLKTQGVGIDCVSFSPDGRRLVSAGDDLTVRVWDAASGENLRTLVGNEIGVRGVSFSPDGKRVISVAWDQAVRVWDAITGNEILTHEGLTGVVPVWDPIRKKRVYLKGSRVVVECVAFSPDLQRLALGSFGLLQVLDVATAQKLLTLQGLGIHVNCLAFSADGLRLATASSDGMGLNESDVRVWDAATGKELLTLKGHRDGVQGMSFSPDGQRLVTAGNDGTVRLCDAATGQELLILKGHTDRIYCVAFSPDGQRLASAGGDGTVRIWEASPVPHEVWRQPR